MSTALLVISLFVSINPDGLPVLSMDASILEPTYSQCLADAAIFNKANYPFEIDAYVAYCLPVIIDDKGNLIEEQKVNSQ